MDKDKLVGTWILESCIVEDEDKNIFHFFGENPKGILIYDEHGNMAGQLSNRVRKELATEDWAMISEEESKAMLMTYQAYFGTYVVHEDAPRKHVVHHVIAGVRSNWNEKMKEIRYYTFSDHQLFLESPPMEIGGKNFIFKVVWNKA